MNQPTQPIDWRPTERDDLPFFPRPFRLWLSAGILAVGAVALIPFDPRISQAVRAIDLPGDVKRGIGLCEAFAHSFGVVLILACLWQAAPDLRRRLPRVIACALLPGIAVNAIKLLVVRLRPIAYRDVPELGWESWVGIGSRFGGSPELNGYLSQSFPSGHAATAIGFALGLAWLFPRGRGMFLAVAVLASLQRVISAAHWPSDTLAAAAVALGVGAFCLTPGPLSRWFDRWERRGHRAMSKGSFRGPSQPLQQRSGNNAA